MPKHEANTPKAIANRMKSKGLQKLRWFCQMCQKQCRDDNGFKMHLMSEGHLRQMKLFAENSGRIMDSYSIEFRDTFLKLLSTRYNTRQVHANQVYQEYISDKNHLHMNATKWTSLTGFIHYLAKAGYCRVEETEKGWFIAWIDKSAKTLAKQEAVQKQERMKRDQEEVERKMIEEQIRRSREMYAESHGESSHQLSEFKRDESEDAIKIALKPTLNPSAALAGPSTKKRLLLDDDEKLDDVSTDISASIATEKISNDTASTSKKSRWDDQPSTSTNEKGKQKATQDSPNQEGEEMPWIRPNIVVKVLTDIANGRYRGQKARVVRIDSDNPFVAELKILDGGGVLKLDQADCETVIPAIGGTVVVLRGKHAGERGTVIKVDFDSYQAKIELADGQSLWLEYEWFSKCIE